VNYSHVYSGAKVLVRTRIWPTGICVRKIQRAAMRLESASGGAEDSMLARPLLRSLPDSICTIVVAISWSLCSSATLLTM